MDKHLQQCINLNKRTAQLEEDYGDEIGAKSQNTVRMLFMNMGGLPFQNSNCNNT